MDISKLLEAGNKESPGGRQGPGAPTTNGAPASTNGYHAPSRPTSYPLSPQPTGYEQQTTYTSETPMGTSSGSGAGAGGSFRPGPPGAHPPAPVQLPPVSSIHAEPTQRGYPSEPSHHYPPHPQQHYVHTPAPSLPSFMSPHGHLAAGLLAQHPLQHGLQPGSAAQGIRSPSAGGHVGIAPAGPAGAAHNIPSKRGPQPGHQGEQPPPKKMGKWTAEEDALAIDLRAKGMKWDDISKRIPGRSPISCRLRYQNYSEKRPDWTEERLNNMAKLYNR